MTAKQKSGGQSERRFGGPRQIGRIIPKITRNALSRRGFAQHEVITDWAHIVGAHLARLTAPERLQFRTNSPGTLQVRVALGAAPEVQHLSPLILERVNAYFGYKAVAQLKLIQAPLQAQEAQPAKPPIRKQKPLTAQQQQHLQQTLKSVEDPELRQILRNIGSSILSESPDDS